MEEMRGFPDWETVRMEMRPRVRYWMPAAAVDEADLKEEVRQLYLRGFGGIEAVSLELPPSVATGSDGWGTKHYKEILEVLSKETKRYGMSLDVAIGPCWPMAFPTVTGADHPGALCELTFGEMELPGGTVYEGALPERKKIREAGTPKLIAAMAYEEVEDHVLRRDSFLDLTAAVTQEQTIRFAVPGDGKSRWKLFAFYEQPACQKINAGSTYVIDHLGKAGAAACKEYWEPVLREYELEHVESLLCDSLEYDVALEWTPGFPEIFRERRGYDLIPYLPFIGVTNVYPLTEIPGYRLKDAAVFGMVNRDYMETVTECYFENHLLELEAMAKEHGKTIRYQVAYNRPIEVERCALAVGVPENEALGRPAIDGLKMMAAAAHLGRKERYSFECAAEFSSSYTQSYEDLFWWVKRSLMAGMNAQILHGASYSGAVPETASDLHVKWPGYEGMYSVVSNNWNRTLSVEDAKGCLDAIGRMNRFFRGAAKVDLGIYRSAYVNDGAESEHFVFPDGGALSRSGYSYEWLPPALLEHENCVVADGLLDGEGAGYQAFLVPPQDHMPMNALRKILALAKAGLPVLLIGERPGNSQFLAEAGNAWKECRDALWDSPRVLHADKVEDAVDALRRAGVYPRLEIRQEGEMRLITAVREFEAGRGYAVYAYNDVQYSPEDPNPDEMSVSANFRKGTTKGSYVRPGAPSRKEIRLCLDCVGTVFLLEPFSGKQRILPFAEDRGHMKGTVSIEEDEILLLYVEPDAAAERGEGKEAPIRGEEAAFRREDSPFREEEIPFREGKVPFRKEEIPFRGEEIPFRKGKVPFREEEIPFRGNNVPFRLNFRTLKLEAFEKDSETETSFLRSGYHGDARIISLDGLKPWSEFDGEPIGFAGRGTYTGVLQVDAIRPDAGYLLTLGEIRDTFRVKLNGKETLFPDQVMKRADLTGLLHEGENRIEVTVTGNLHNRICSAGREIMGYPLPFIPQEYGMWETDTKKFRLEEYRL